MNDGDYSDLFCVVFCADGVRWYFYDYRRKKIMSAVVGTIVVVASVIILLCPWIAEEVRDMRWSK